MESREIQGWAMEAVGEPLVIVKTKSVASPEITEDWVLVEVAGCGVCHTDLSYLFDGVPVRGAMPLVLGHEIAGTVIDTGSSAKDWQGKQVVVPAVMPCGECESCKDGRPGICRRQVFPGNDIPGGFASHVVVPSRGLCEVPSALASRLADLCVVADAVTTPLNAVERSGLRRDQLAIFVGAGGIGAFGIQIAKAKGAHVIAIDIRDERLALAAQHGADATLDVKDLDVKAARKTVRGLVKREGWPDNRWHIFETSGTPQGQELSFSLVNFGATMMVVGYTQKTVTLRLSNLMAFEARAEGVWGCPPQLYPKALDLIEKGQVVLDPFIEHQPMANINDLMTSLHNGGAHQRVVLTPDF